jgi:hypothetical protein
MRDKDGNNKNQGGLCQKFYLENIYKIVEKQFRNRTTEE